MRICSPRYQLLSVCSRDSFLFEGACVSKRRHSIVMPAYMVHDDTNELPLGRSSTQCLSTDHKCPLGED